MRSDIAGKRGRPGQGCVRQGAAAGHDVNRPDLAPSRKAPRRFTRVNAPDHGPETKRPMQIIGDRELSDAVLRVAFIPGPEAKQTGFAIDRWPGQPQLEKRI